MNPESPLNFPKQADKNRIAQYDHYDKIYSGDHFSAFSIKGDKDFSQRYNRLRYLVANFGGIVSRVAADMLFGETLTIEFEDDQNQAFYQSLAEDNQLVTQLYESELANSRRGDGIFKLRVGPRNPEIPGAASTVIIEENTPKIYFPELSQQATRYTPTKDVLAMIFVRQSPTTGATNTYLHKEIHSPGYIFHEVYGYDPTQEKITSQEDPLAFGYPVSEETGVKRSLVFHVPNVRDGSGFWGTSDYQDLDSLFFALNNRLTKLDNILDKHSDPILAVPPGVIDEEGKVKKERLGMFEVDNENPGFNKPEYIVWNANLEYAFKEVDKLVEMLFLFSEVSPAGTPIDAGGVAESGRALKFKLLSAIRKRNRKIRYYDQLIKDMLETAIELALANGVAIDGNKPGKPERPTIKWGDGVINDEVEMVDIAVARVDAGLSSRADEIARLDDISSEKAEAKVKEIDAESALTVPAVGSGLSGGGAAPTPSPSAVKPIVPAAESSAGV